MADNVNMPLTGIGDATAVAATDDVLGFHYQKVKLADGTADSSTMIVAGGGVEASAMRVTLASDSTGVLTVKQATAANLNATVVGTGTLAVQDSQVIADNAAFTDGTSKVFPVGYIYDEVAGTALTENDVAAGRINLNRAQVNTIEDGVTRGRYATVTAANALKVDASGAAVPVTDNAASLTVDWNGTAPPIGAGVEATALRVTVATDSTGVLSVDDNGGTLTVDQATASNLNAQVVGEVAHDGVDSGNPISVGGIARQANPTAVAALDRVKAMFDDVGRLVTVPHHVRDLVSHQHTQIASSSAETTIVTAGGAGVFNDIISLVITNQTATAVNVTIKDSTAGTTRMIVALAASGGAVITPSAPIPQLAAAANNWTATLSSAAVTVNIFVQYAKNV